MPEKKFELLVLGGGTGGYAAAFRASELGFNVGLVERERLGGTCLHKGCIPTKSFLHTAELLESLKLASRFGINITGQSLDWPGVVKAKNEAVSGIYAGLLSLAQARHVELVAGDGRLESADAVQVQGEGGTMELAFDNLCLATGSRPRLLPDPAPGGPVITSDEALELPSIPKSIVIIGGGYVGVEFASLWRTFGSEVTLVEAAPRLMVHEDEEISAALNQALSARGIEIFLNAGFEAAIDDAEVVVEIKVDGQTKTVRSEKLMVAVGREPVTDGFAGAGIDLDRGFVSVDENYMTSRERVYAVGDLLATPQLAHVAFAEGIFVAEKAAGLKPAAINYNAVPRCVYSHPEVAAVGLTEAEARRQGRQVVTARERFAINSKAAISGEVEGKAKIVAEKDGPILGIHMIGAKVTELISEAMLVTGWGAEPIEVAGLIHPHPTLSEVIGEASLKLAGKPLHSL